LAVLVAVVGDHPPEFARRWNSFAPQVKVAAQPVRVTFDNQSSQRATILEVFAHDAPGLLYGVSMAI
jgi:UTP:GlnB (protein PII) uridylyltransferase